jgi:hypothetical protein
VNTGMIHRARLRRWASVNGTPCWYIVVPLSGMTLDCYIGMPLGTALRRPLYAWRWLRRGLVDIRIAPCEFKP